MTLLMCLRTQGWYNHSISHYHVVQGVGLNGTIKMSKDKLFHYKATVTRVVDGDTVDVSIDLGFDIHMKARIRLAGINAPESRTKDLVEKAAGIEAKNYVSKWCSDKGWEIIVKTELDGKGKFGRVLGKILSSDGECLNDLLVEDGHAELYEGGKR
jgi:endonuclease YncB( thermonuclease family)